MREESDQKRNCKNQTVNPIDVNVNKHCSLPDLMIDPLCIKETDSLSISTTAVTDLADIPTRQIVDNLTIAATTHLVRR
ncbi:hypothetical protein KPH14_009725 [Odynerus spinipes]|uniref:Uncharacterized protein n=1 Tax=Odynerus spinipes TaxID=1348599 RepID=A0AAD9VQX6_9HYME|nr:hypothetical protein KPH14_009725 [Odynerus spinipes]